MTGDEGPRAAPPDGREPTSSGWLGTLKRLSPWGQRRATERLEALVREAVARLDAGVGQLQKRTDEVEETIRTIQRELDELRVERTARVETRLDAVEAAQARIADEVVPAVVERGNLLVDRLAGELEEVASLVERMLLGEPLPVPQPSASGARLARELAEVQPAVLAAFRGPSSEIGHRLQRHLPTLASSPPVLDLGCGRGELLLLLREAGVEARGVEQDPALVEGARRRGLEVLQGEALEVLEAQPTAALGAVTAIHLLEHLEAAVLLRLLKEVHRVLRPGGVFIAECPNPHSLRVGGAFFWQDPTHVRPLLPETLRLYLETSGFEVRGLELLHPFPEEQRLTAVASGPSVAAPEVQALAERLQAVAQRLDDILNGPRDFAIVAGKASGGGTG